MRLPSAKSLSENNRLLIFSLVVGLLSGLASVLLLKSIGAVAALVSALLERTRYNWAFLVMPGLGMLMSLLLLRFVVRDNISHGVTKVLVAISKNESRIKVHNTWSSMLTSAVTIGLGGSVGAEAPIVYTGAAIGSNVARVAGLSYKNMTVLLGCGAAGAIAGIFKAPLAGVLFTMEILLFNISMSSMMPLLLSSVSAAVVSYIFMGAGPFFEGSLEAFSMRNIPFYAVLGLIGGFGSLYFLRTTLWLEDKLGSMKGVYGKWLLCAAGLGVLIFLFPTLYGEGYISIRGLLNGHLVVEESQGTPLSGLLGSGTGVMLFLLMVFLLKVFAMTLTNAGGGVGGTFGPTLFEGAILGFVVARAVNLLGFSVPEQNFALVGMAAMMSGVMQAPLTAIFLVAEMTGGYGLLLPLIITSTVSFGTMRVFERYSIYSKRIANRGELLTHDNDQAVLTLLKTSQLVRDKYPRVGREDTLRQVVSVISSSTAAVLPVVDSQDRFLGLVDVDSARSFIFKTDSYDTLHVYDFMQAPPEYIYIDEHMSSVMSKFDRTQAWRLPVLDHDRHYMGFISRSRLLSAYREELKVISQD